MYVQYYLLLVSDNKESVDAVTLVKESGDETINVIDVTKSRRLRQWLRNNRSGICVREYPSLIQVQLTCPKCEEQCSCVCEFDVSNVLSEDSDRYGKSVKLISVNTLPTLIASIKDSKSS